MESKGIDPVEFRGVQREQWDHAATGWKKWSGWLDDHAGVVSERLVALAGIEPGQVVRAEGLVSVQDGRKVMFNPRYELRPAGGQ